MSEQHKAIVRQIAEMENLGDFSLRNAQSVAQALFAFSHQNPALADQIWRWLGEIEAEWIRLGIANDELIRDTWIAKLRQTICRVCGKYAPCPCNRKPTGSTEDAERALNQLL